LDSDTLSEIDWIVNSCTYTRYETVIVMTVLGVSLLGLIFDPEDGDCAFLRFVGEHLPDYIPHKKYDTLRLHLRFLHAKMASFSIQDSLIHSERTLVRKQSQNP
jgi:hypothetical protein